MPFFKVCGGIMNYVIWNSYGPKKVYQLSKYLGTMAIDTLFWAVCYLQVILSLCKYPLFRNQMWNIQKVKCGFLVPIMIFRNICEKYREIRI